MPFMSIVHLIFWTFVFFLALSFFGISIQAIVNSPAGQANLNYLAGVAAHLLQLAQHYFLWATEWIRPLTPAA